MTARLLDALPRHPLDPSADGLLLLTAAVLLAIGVVCAIAIAVQMRRGAPSPAKRSEHGLPIDSWGIRREHVRG